MKKFLAALLALSLTFGSVALPAVESGVIARGVNISAKAETYGDFEYDFLDDGTIEITKYTGNGGNVVIPSTINGKKVTSIGYGAFEDCSELESIILGDGLISIDDYAFNNCNSLTSITIPNSVTSIGCGAFKRCGSLKNIMIPASVTSIGDSVFSGCSSLTSITVDSKNSYYSSEDGVLFNKTKSELISYPNDKPNEKYIVPSSVTIIDSFAFDSCYNFTSIIIPDSVTSIGDAAFYLCAKLSNITIGSGLTTIGEGVFWECYFLTSITVDSNNKNFSSENGVLFNKDKSKLVAYPAGNSIKKYTIPSGVTSICSTAFWNCLNLENLTIPNTITYIAKSAFLSCENLTDIYYTGSADDWTKIKIGDYNEDLTNATIHYNYDPNHTHSYTEKITKQPTCTATGEKIKTCSICGMKLAETIPAKGHTAVTDKAVPATCTTNGKTAGSHCSVCGKVIKAQTVIKAKGHTSSSWIIDKQPAVGVKGSKHKECTVCGKILEKAEIPALAATDISGASVTLSTTSYTYNGKAKKPTATVTLNGKTLKKDVDYTVKYSSNTAIGKAKITITGKGNYKGTVSKTFKILLTKQTIAKLTAQKKGFALTWTKDKNVTGYQIQYDVKSDLKSAKSAYVKSKSTYKKTISGLKAKKTYYVRVRSYKTVGGVKYYGSWSANKKIKTK